MSQARVLVKEKIADTGVDLLRANFEVDLGLEMSDEELRGSIGELRRDPDPLGDEDDRRADRAGRPT